MGKLSNLFLKGFVFGIGRSASNTFIKQVGKISSNQRFWGLSTRAQYIAILFWVAMFFPIGHFFGITYNMLWFLFGLIPTLILFKIFSSK